MKKITLFACLILVLCNTKAPALTVTDVGDYDQYLDSKAENLNKNQEFAWFLEFFPEYNAEDLIYYKPEPAINWVSTTNDDSAIYYDFSGVNAYPLAFLIKGGIAGGAFNFDDGINVANNVSTVLFTNIESMQYGLIDLDWFEKLNGRFEIDAISHTSYVNGPEMTVIPEPSTLVLLGGGFLGIVIWRKMRYKIFKFK